MGSLLWMGGAALVAIPAFVMRLGGISLPAYYEASLYGIAILGAAFLLTWGTEIARKDISQSLALALLALIAVLPEYAVDFYFAWQGGKDPQYIHYATANMTGANRLLIGLGWALVVFLFWLKWKKREIALEQSHSVELGFLAIATLYVLHIPFKGYLSPIDSVILIGMFFFYLWTTSRGERKEPELAGPAAIIGSLPPLYRRLAALFLFLFSAAAILASAEPFAEGLVHTGKLLKIDEFLLVQWLAPLASEAPEIAVASIFTLRGDPGMGLGVLVSSKVNQWTLLIGSLPVVFSFSSGHLASMPLDGRQVEEVFLTAAQSAFAVVVLANLRISLREAGALFLLFVTQLFFPDPRVRWGYSALYLFLTLILIVANKEARLGLMAYIPSILNQGRRPRKPLPP